MSLVTKALALATHAFFFREGDAFLLPAPGECGVNSVPDADDDGWIELAAIESAEDSIVEEEKKTIWRPVPGHLVRSDIITLKQGMDHKFTTNEWTPAAVESFYRTSQKLDEDSDQANPLSSVPRKGWLKLQRYDQTDVLVLIADVWVRLTVSGGMKMGGSDLVMPEFLAEQLYSQYNSFALGT